MQSSRLILGNIIAFKRLSKKLKKNWSSAEREWFSELQYFITDSGEKPYIIILWEETALWNLARRREKIEEVYCVQSWSRRSWDAWLRGKCAWSKHLLCYRSSLFQLSEQIRKQDPNEQESIKEEAEAWESELGELRSLLPMELSRDALKQQSIPSLQTDLQREQANLPDLIAAKDEACASRWRKDMF